MAKYRKKPVVIEAVQLGDSKEDIATACRFCGPLQMFSQGRVSFGVKTLEGRMRGNVGDWLIKGVAGEFYFCKPDIFEQTYEAVED